MKSSEIRRRFIDFFEKRGHKIIKSASLISSDEKGVTNPTLFNTAGMQPLIPYLLGKPHPLGKRLADVQKCLRTIDIDDVGDETHATFFEMLGNWSLGDYFKKEAIEWSYEFLTSKEEGLGLDPSRLYVTVFEGDENAPRDDEAAKIWLDIFKANRVEGERVFFMSAETNWWEAGDSGPCGPDTEMYFDVKGFFNSKGISKQEFIEADSKNEVVEVWNDVFMQYEKRNGQITGKLEKPSVDTGAGLERLAMTLQGVDNIYDTDLFGTIMKTLENCTNFNLKSARIVADHLRASVFLISDGIIPFNTGRGYVLRRLIRRATLFSNKLGISDLSHTSLVDTVFDIYKDVYEEFNDDLKRSAIKEEISKEINNFKMTLDMGVRKFQHLIKSGIENISGQDAFMLFSSYGLPIDVTVDIAKERGLSVDKKGYEAEFKKHQETSRSGAEKKFKGGLADTSEKSLKYHTATHLLHQALIDVLGDEVRQKGSNITPERLRFDFTFGRKLTEDEKNEVESIVNEKISENLTVDKVVMPIDEAKKTGAKHFFGEKYGDSVSVYFIGEKLENAYSKEFCGGPHVNSTGDLGNFKITKEESVAQGIRRIKAILE
ncbi:MAG: hypothetical protein A3G52_00820 [Candidatus Taylorbacteria bacterium RIFCSPLOWO2_12_FULL_43_20]|uniref:Alanine--tRNA ligase n=1 Tax=Candidatus Taylorbacteria bacterium RIFCSPLOWO2_12_FULL_43_20 TaxID=1802332 RepID=A0A1G2NZG2_9BACT|nr:MAG: hypothetical protein A2825_03265 [Candidatus Taylorbacteria bacterium RIFCSPHIGHO2_01_FULL_43_120]OHA23700.1 MAG: hypothetical protein A3B98_00670 [Candidatus Taylorbacteria bacterium RIFCSPHIGHO2_02_FULL_43_55]OHA27953.1 MAG: hypothetical protein A3E92_02985 [Candidatus Taylorbacteria bacterium RIFCSPHIGHO2_12_FULL_42_34]OHA32048.1 MAG: hypothetical protein A3B09_02865 [Candidatus Taylorbacteria bacterium RIFCSPLOWO2_01_FULL_43_83]OHA39798.1 MAG: hypothetical protein A3H58_03640 [Candi